MSTRPDGVREGPEVHELFAYLCVRDADAAIDFYTRVFGARETLRLADPEGRIGHAELELGPATLMVCDEHPEHGILAPPADEARTSGASDATAAGSGSADAAAEPSRGTGVTIHLHVDDVDRLAERAVAAGATILREPTDFAHGERQCRIRDPFGHAWLLGHPIEELSNDEIARRHEAEHGDVPAEADKPREITDEGGDDP
ncbi:MAG: VOC family protein [Gemmatimonadota bacterium]